MSAKEQALKMFPNYFKYVGIGVIIFAFLLKPLIINYFEPEVGKLLALNGIIAGLLIIAFSRDKIEDEMIMNIRLKAMSIGFLFPISYVLISPFFDYFLVIQFKIYNHIN